MEPDGWKVARCSSIPAGNPFGPISWQGYRPECLGA